MTSSPLPHASPSIVILAAGKGTRMKSRRPKVLHEIGRRAMLHHVLAAAGALDPREVVLVVGPDMEEVAASARGFMPGVKVAVQTEQLGTGDAVRAALAQLEAREGDVVVLFGDTPLIRPQTISLILEKRSAGGAIVVLGFRPADPARYGRLVTRDGAGGLEVERIVEYADASAAERAITLCNAGIMAFDAAKIEGLLGGLENHNAKGEFYLTDTIALARSGGLSVYALEAHADEVVGINSRLELAMAELLFQARARAMAMDEGATLIDPSSVYFAADTKIGQDVVIGPNVVFGPDVEIADNVTIEAFCHIEGALVAAGARVGPFARLRPGAEIGHGAHIGNFVEIKKARVEEGAKVNHLTYIGDARIGAKANIGAGTITCNYDGYDKHFTDIGGGAFIGSNTALIAPVRVGDGAYVGSGSVIAADVEPDSLALTRAQLIEKPGWAGRLRERKRAAKGRKEGE